MTKWIVPLFALAACGDNLSPPVVPPPPDAPPPWAEAPHGTAPTLVNLGGAVLSAPKLQPIFFANDATMQAVIEDFAPQMAASTYWKTTTAEYGVGDLTVLPTIVTMDAPPTTDSGLASFLSTKLDGTHTAEGWPATVDPQTIYSLFTPQGVVVSEQGFTSCQDYGAYHDEAMGAHGESIVYAFMPRCAGQDDLTISYSHEVIEAVTDPYVETTPAFGDADPDNYVMAITPGAETGDYCEYLDSAYIRAVGPYAVQRTWSNAASLAGKDPCVPAPATPYVAGVPMWTEKATIQGFTGSVQTKGMALPVGMSKTVDVQLISDVPTDLFEVRAFDLGAMFGGSPELTFAWDKANGKNGDVLKLTITRKKAGQLPGSELVIQGIANGKPVSMWWGYVN